MQGYILLAVQAHVPSLHPPPCNPGQQTTTCESVHGSNLSLLLLGLYLIPIGDGAARACLPALGGEQFNKSDPVEQRQEASFFNWYTFAVSSGGFVGLVFVVWVENSKGWDIGFVVCALCVLLGMLISRSTGTRCQLGAPSQEYCRYALHCIYICNRSNRSFKSNFG